MIPVEIANVAVLEKRFIIFLKSKDDERVLPIFIDEQQAQSIIIQINHVEIPRPLTHDLFKTGFGNAGIPRCADGGFGRPGRHLLCPACG